MKKVLKIVGIMLVVLFLAAQVIRPSQENPPVDPSQTIEAKLGVPSDVQAIFARACNDCHTNTTRYPWYSQIAPVSWWMADHVEEGREHLNFSVWGTYDGRRQHHKLEEICEVIQEGEMPLASYKPMHSEADLSQSDIQRLCEWARVEQQKLIASGVDVSGGDKE